MHKIALTSKVWDLLDGSGVMQGQESPEIRAEMVALKRNSKGVSGSVSLNTVGWLLGTLEALKDSPEQGDARAATAAIDKLNPIYEENGGTWTTVGELRAEEEATTQSAREPEHQNEHQEQEHEEQSPAVGWTHGELRGLPLDVRDDSEARFMYGGKGGKRSVKPSQSTLAGVRYVGSGRYEVWDAATGAVLLTGALQSQVWWAPAPSVDGGATDRNRPEIQTVSHGGYGRPVFHARTGALVGYLAPDRFTHIGELA